MPVIPEFGRILNPGQPELHRDLIKKRRGWGGEKERSKGWSRKSKHKVIKDTHLLSVCHL